MALKNDDELKTPPISPVPSGKDSHKVIIVTADPSGLGLFSLAMVTLVASSQKLGITTGYSFLLPWAIFLGAFGQLFACFQESKRNNTFGTTAFGGFAFFWFAVGTSWLIKMGVLGISLSENIDENQLGLAYSGFFLFSFYLTISAMGVSKIIFIILCFVDLLLVTLALSTFGRWPYFTIKLAGFSEFIISMLSFYGSAASVINNSTGRIVLPVGKPFGAFLK